MIRIEKTKICHFCFREYKSRRKYLVCESCRDIIYKKRWLAMSEFRKELRQNENFTAASKCELCDSNKNIVAHHYNGYDNPLDVWWICQSCNSRLSSPIYHSGIVNKTQAKMAVRSINFRKVIIERRIVQEVNK